MTIAPPLDSGDGSVRSKDSAARGRQSVRDLVKVGAPFIAVVTLLLQAVAYSLTSAFYGGFGVTAEEVGFSYSDLLGRRALQIALLVVVVGVVFTAFYLILGVYVAIGSFATIASRRPQVVHQGGSDGWSKLTFYVALVATVLSIALAPSIGGWFALVAAVIVILELAIQVKRGYLRSSIVFRMLLRPRYTTSGRIFLFTFAAGLLVGGPSAPSLRAWERAGLAASVGFLLVVVDRFIPRADDFDPPAPPSRAVRLASEFYSTWAVRFAIIPILLAAFVVGVGALDLVVVQARVEQDISRVDNGQTVHADPLSLNPLDLSAPHADRAVIQWIGTGQPLGLFRNGTATLLYFGANTGISVFYDPKSKQVIRIPSSSVTVTTEGPFE